MPKRLQKTSPKGVGRLSSELAEEGWLASVIDILSGSNPPPGYLHGISHSVSSLQNLPERPGTSLRMNAQIAEKKGHLGADPCPWRDVHDPLALNFTHPASIVKS